MPRALLDWDKVRLAIIERHEQLERRGIHRFSIRFLHYYFKQVRPELGVGRPKNPYKSLNEHITAWKRDPESGIKREWFIDTSRPDATRAPEHTPEANAAEFAKYLLDSVDNYSPYLWFKQPVYVEVWVEKEAMKPIIEDMLSGMGVRVVVCKGYIGDTKLGEHTKRLARWQAKGKKIVILYLGDLDPSGENMDEIMPRRMDDIGTSLDVDDPDKFEIRRLAVREEHIKKFKLTKLGPEPEPGKEDDAITKELRERLKKDPRAPAFMANHKSIEHPNGELFCVELDAMASEEAIDELEKIVKKEIRKLYKQKIFDKYASEYFTDEQVGKWMVKKIDAVMNKVRDDWRGDGKEPLKAPDDYAEGSDIERFHREMEEQSRERHKEELEGKSETFTEEEEIQDLQKSRQELEELPENKESLKKLLDDREHHKQTIYELEAGDEKPSRYWGIRSIGYYKQRLIDIEANILRLYEVGITHDDVESE
jgi:hypothetical protein